MRDEQDDFLCILKKPRLSKMDLSRIPTLMIGAGRVGTAIAFCLKEKGVPIIGVTNLDPKKGRSIARKFKLPYCENYLSLLPKARLVLIAVNDDAISEVAKSLHESSGLKPGTFLAHFSGALSSEILKKKRRKIFAFSLHPLRSFQIFQGNCSYLKGTPMIFEGDKESQHIGEQLAKCLGGKFIKIKMEEKPLYHAAATMAGNFLVTLVSAACRLNEKAGISRKDSLPILMPLLKSTLSNLEKMGVPDALTGPIERGDLMTVKKHLHLLANKSRDLVSLYRILALETLKLARAKGLSPEKAEALRKILGAAHGKSNCFQA